jgi:DNA-binding XRE family transcriptional regulator
MVQSSAEGGSGLALFAAELQAARARAGLSQAELAERVS